MILNRIKIIISNSLREPIEDEYLEIDLEQEGEKENKVHVRLFVLKRYEDVDDILNALRGGYTIAIIDFKTLKQKDPIELKRAVSKIKKTVDALEGNIAGYENLVIATSSFAKIHKETSSFKPEKKDKIEDF